MITLAQIRSARAFLNLSQDQLASDIGITKQALSRIESGAVSKPHVSTMEGIQKALESKGIEFTKDGGIKPETSSVTILEGDDSFLRLMNDIYLTLKESKEEILWLFVDDAESPPEVLEIEQQIMRAKIPSRSIVKAGSQILYDPKDYRVVSANYFTNSPAVIYGNKVAFIADTKITDKIMILQNEVIASIQRNIFNFAWDHCPAPIAGGPS